MASLPQAMPAESFASLLHSELRGLEDRLLALHRRQCRPVSPRNQALPLSPGREPPPASPSDFDVPSTPNRLAFLDVAPRSPQANRLQPRAPRGEGAVVPLNQARSGARALDFHPFERCADGLDASPCPSSFGAASASNGWSCALRVSPPSWPSEVGGGPEMMCSQDSSMRRSWILRSWGSTVSLSHDASLLERMVKSDIFEVSFLLLILVNCATTGMYAHFVANPIHHELFWLDAADIVFAVLFSLELFVRMRVYGLEAFNPTAGSGEHLWNFVEAMLVLLTGIVGWLLTLLFSVFSINVDGALKLFNLLRALRMLRLIRVMQKVQFFHEVWMLLRGISDSGRTLLWTCVIIFFITYMCAVLGMVTITHPLLEILKQPLEESMQKRLQRSLVYVRGLDDFMYTLIQVLCGDSWNAVVRDVMHFLPASWIYFYSYVSVAVLVLMNLVTAIIVENALSTAAGDEHHAEMVREQQEKLEFDKLVSMFRMMDTDGSGTISWVEFQNSFSDPEISQRWKSMNFRCGREDCLELFSLLDNGDGTIDMDQFFTGLSKMKGAEISMEMFRLNRAVERIGKNLERISSAVLKDQALRT